MLRALLTVGIAVFPLLATPQGKADNDPEKTAPQIIVNVRKHPIGADMVSVTVASKAYPMDLLKTQCEALGTSLGSDARGLAVTFSGEDERFRFVRASFATDHIIDREKGQVRLQNIVRSFLGAPAPHTLTSFMVTLEGEEPVEKQTIQDYASDKVIVKAHFSKDPKGIEYRILALTQVPNDLVIPDKYVPPTPVQKAVPKQEQRPPATLTLGLVALAGIAGAALVYFGLAGRAASASRRATQGRD
ncbi:MAG: hypothetical protein JSS66_00970 [Armatimonadetes bacterium]|nr:hypothetical protein [Armatimonadota bacterium]